MAAAVGKRRNRRKVSGTSSVGKTRRRRRVSGTAAVGRSHHSRPRKHRVSGTAVGRTHHHKPRKRRSSVGSTKMNMGMLKEIGKMALGVTGGVMANNLILMPAERMIEEKVPMAAKFMGAAQALLGGYIALKAKGNLGKSFGLTILAGGAQSVVRQFKLGTHIPGIAGPNDEYTTVKIPMSGPTELRSYVAGVLESNEAPNWPGVAGHRRGHAFREKQHHNVQYSGDQSGDYRLKSYLAGEEEDLLPLKGLRA